MSDREQSPQRSVSLIDRYRQPHASTPPRDDDSGDSLVAESYVVMLDLVLSNGNHYALPYATLLRVLYNPSSGIRLVFSTDDVEITGMNLDEVYRGIVQHRLPRLEVQRTRPGVETGPGVAVTAIKVTPKD